jgi:hypothetical protein
MQPRIPVPVILPVKRANRRPLTDSSQTVAHSGEVEIPQCSAAETSCTPLLFLRVRLLLWLCCLLLLLSAKQRRLGGLTARFVLRRPSCLG